MEFSFDERSIPGVVVRRTHGTVGPEQASSVDLRWGVIGCHRGGGINRRCIAGRIIGRSRYVVGCSRSIVGSGRRIVGRHRSGLRRCVIARHSARTGWHHRCNRHGSDWHRHGFHHGRRKRRHGCVISSGRVVGDIRASGRSKHWHHWPVDNRLGICHRHAPECRSDPSNNSDARGGAREVRASELRRLETVQLIATEVK